jgi:hypothetical protein
MEHKNKATHKDRTGGVILGGGRVEAIYAREKMLAPRCHFAALCVGMRRFFAVVKDTDRRDFGRPAALTFKRD